MEDVQIIELYVNREQQAIIQTKNKYERYCMVIAANILYSREDSEECVSDTWLHTWNSIPPESPKCLRAFVGAITRNLSLDRYRRIHAKKRGEGRVQSIEQELEQCVGKNETQERVDHMALTESINTFLRNQTQEKRVIFVRRYWYLDDIKAISERMDIREGKIKTILFRMRKELKAHLEKEEIWI